MPSSLQEWVALASNAANIVAFVVFTMGLVSPKPRKRKKRKR